ncbi:hypothetical protein L2D08_19375 [Domibacillus sp. PGB-M46]|uniref:hypothetical protein n=1 Tax=Domibacillus sp. PGB-M46 TaxID=2910255 RepID=UPI001F575228|nr:hypothetical protein [Domibacillus sp. PGB-M46]MCI2256504.1 hypothetical protein [Domibacillus sp. PGB-M46]
MSTNIIITHPILMQKALEIVLEVTTSVIESDNYKELNSLIKGIGKSSAADKLVISKEAAENLSKCIALFKQSTTCHWLRQDLLDLILKVERGCSKQMI